MVASRRAFALVATLGALVFVAVGATGADAAPSPTYRFVAGSSGALTGRVFSAAATDVDSSSVVLYGGEVPNDASHTIDADTWVYEPGTGWVAKCGSSTPGATAPCGPGARSTAGMASGPSGPVLFGGSPTGIDGGGSPPLSDTWTWQHGAWTQVCASGACGPSGRLFPGLGGNGHQVVLFGGLGQSGMPDDTWVFDGHTWTQTCGSSIAVPCNAPPVLGPSIGWDGTEFVMFGGAPMGSGDIGAPTDDTWTFDGTAWTHVCGTSIGTPCGPSARALGGVGFQRAADPNLQGALLAGGGSLFGNGTQHLDRDVWRYRAGGWTQLPTPWPSTRVTFANNTQPPPDSGPLLPIVVARPADCQVLFLGQNPARAATFTVSPQTYTGGWDLSGSGQPSGCVVDPAATPVTAPVGTTGGATPAAAVATSALPSTGAGSPTTTATMARTGRESGRLAAIGAISILLGLLAIAVTRRSAPVYSGSTGSR